MTTLHNPAREKLAAGELALGFTVRMVRSVEIAPAAKAAGFDWLFLDCEHGSLGLDAAAQIAVAGLEAGIAPIARVPNGEYAIATRLLDNGVLGIVVPHVDTEDEAREVVQRLKYPPVGHRSIGGIGPHYGLTSLKIGAAAAAMNAANLIVVMLETPEAIRNADAIAAVNGVDVLLIGTNDLSFEMGIPGEFSNARVVEAYENTINACRNHGKHAGMGGIYAEDIMERYIRMGARFNLAGGDQAFMMAAAANRSAALHRMLPRDHGQPRHGA
ncbi:MAG: aldolase/citrate lyase family protein [Pseudomonadota bacterium]|nr:aldolase/citrate lyase family protein [Pseudomonadota bacterium]